MSNVNLLLGFGKFGKKVKSKRGNGMSKSTTFLTFDISVFYIKFVAEISVRVHSWTATNIEPFQG